MRRGKDINEALAAKVQRNQPKSAQTEVSERPMAALERREGRVERYIDSLTDKAIEAIGANKDLSAALLHAGDGANEKAQKLLILLADPRCKGRSLSRLSREVGLTSVELVEILRGYYSQLAVTKVIAAAPEIADDILSDARRSLVECPRCDGLGRIENTLLKKVKLVICPRCKGRKLVVKAGNADARKIIAEMNGWTKRESAVTVNVGSGPGNLQSVLSELDKEGQVLDL